MTAGVSSSVENTKIIFDEPKRSIRLGDGDPVVLRAKSFAVFMALTRSAPNPLSKDALIEEVWGQTAVSDDSITQCIADIRRALGKDGRALLQTHPGVGYSLLAETRAEGGTAKATLPPRQKRFWILFGVASALAVLLAAAVVMTTLLSAPPEPASATAQASKPSVAALTFDTIGGAPDLAAFAEALRNDIVVSLSALDTVSVLAPSILELGSAPDETPLRAYTAKGAGYVIGGTIQSAGSTLRVSAHLIDTSTSQIVWVRRWENAQGDFLALQDEVVKALAAELANPWSGRLTGLGTELAADDASAQLSADDLVRLGASRFRDYHPQAFAEAEQHFRKALERDARHAEAWAGLSFVLGAMLPMAAAEDVKGLRDARANSGRQAYHLGEESGRSLLAGSWTAALRGNETEKLRRLREAVAKLQGDADALAIAALQGAMTTDLYTEAAGWAEQALASNPDAPPWYFLGPGVASFFQGDLERAKDNLKQAPQSLPMTMVFLAAAHAASDEIDQANTVLATLRMLHNGFDVTDFLAAELFAPEGKAEKLRTALSSAGIIEN